VRTGACVGCGEQTSDLRKDGEYGRNAPAEKVVPTLETGNLRGTGWGEIHRQTPREPTASESGRVARKLGCAGSAPRDRGSGWRARDSERCSLSRGSVNRVRSHGKSDIVWSYRRLAGAPTQGRKLRSSTPGTSRHCSSLAVLPGSSVRQKRSRLPSGRW